MPQDPSGLGYAYHLPSGGILLRIRNTLSQFSDLFSEFNKFITPAPYHDRCERSVHMRLYSLSKREFIGAILAFFVCEFLSIFIGLAGKYELLKLGLLQSKKELLISVQAHQLQPQQ